jgi:excisionase family DNA binding protein
MQRILLKPDQVAEALPMRQDHNRLIAEGTIPSLRIGGSVRVTLDALRAWIAQQMQHLERRK